MKKYAVRLLGLLISISMILSLVVNGFAVSDCDCDNSPVIFIAGFGATTLCRVNDDASEEAVFPPSTDIIVQTLKNNIKKFNEKGYSFSDWEQVRTLLHGVVYDILEPISINEDGTSKYNLKPIYSSVEDTSYAGFVKNNATKYIPYYDSDFLDMKSAAERLGDDHVFNFLFDWRQSGDTIADELLTYIEQVRAYTGHSKVSIYCLSQGSVPVTQYLYKYADKGYIDNLVFDNPIFEGSYFVSDFLNGADGTYSLEIDEMLDLLENIIHTEFDISQILGALPDDDIVPFVNTEVKLAGEEVIFPAAANAPAYLEMLPTEYYETVASTYFSQAVKEKADVVMNGYRKDVKGTLQSAMGDGINLSIVSSSGLNLVTGTHIQSDAIVNLSSSCGAYCAENGTTFPMDYVQKVDTGKNNISPDRTIDLSCGYVPEKTWILNERYHGQVEWAPNSLALMEELLFTDNLTDAYSSAKFPQFIQSDDRGQNVWASFENTNSLYGVKGTNGKVVLKNTSKDNCLLITEVTVEGADVLTELSCPIKLFPNETAMIEIDTSKSTTGKIQVKYAGSDTFFYEQTKTFNFSITDNFSGVLSDVEIEITEQNIMAQLIAKVWSLALKLIGTAYSLVQKIK